MNDEKPIRVQRVELIDKQGRTRAVFGAENDTAPQPWRG